MSRGIEATTLSSSTQWWNGPQWLIQQPTIWPTTEVNTPIHDIEVRNVHVAVLQPEEDITSRFSKLNRLIRVIAYCRRIKKLQNFKDQQASYHPLHTRLGPGSDLLCEDGTTGFLLPRYQGASKETRGCS